MNIPGSRCRRHQGTARAAAGNGGSAPATSRCGILTTTCSTQPCRHLSLPGGGDRRGVAHSSPASDHMGGRGADRLDRQPAHQQLMAEQGCSPGAGSCRATCCATASATWRPRASRCWAGKRYCTGTGEAGTPPIFAWTSFRQGWMPASAGYPVVMAPAQSLYLDLAWSPDIPARPGLYWAGPSNLEQVYRCDPAPVDFHASSSILGC